MTAPAPPAAGAGRGRGGRSATRVGGQPAHRRSAPSLLVVPRHRARPAARTSPTARSSVHHLGGDARRVRRRDRLAARGRPPDRGRAPRRPATPRSATRCRSTSRSTGRFGSLRGPGARPRRALAPGRRARAPARCGTRPTDRGVFQVIRIEVRVDRAARDPVGRRVHPRGAAPARRRGGAPARWRSTGSRRPPRSTAASTRPRSPPSAATWSASVRPYAPGDPAHLVHWPSTARTGTLVVRELEPPAPIGQAIVVDLRDLGPDKERAASYAHGRGAGGARRRRRAGAVHLRGARARAPARVRAPIEAGRRLARAVAAEPGAPPEGGPSWRSGDERADRAGPPATPTASPAERWLVVGADRLAPRSRSASPARPRPGASSPR